MGGVGEVMQHDWALTDSVGTFFGIIWLREHFFFTFYPPKKASIILDFRLIICIILY